MKYLVGYTRIVQVIVFQKGLGAQLDQEGTMLAWQAFSQECCCAVFSQLAIFFETAQLALFGNRAQEHMHMDIARTRNIFFITKPRNKQLIL